MKAVRIIFIIGFAGILLLPLIFFNFTPDAVSEIDNKVLAGNPFEAEGDFTTNVEKYVSERVGLRNEMILAYTVANDVLFNEMVHPTYDYGKDGEVFLNFGSVRKFDSYLERYVPMVKKISDYCAERGVPFVFVFEPSKNSVVRDKLPDGYNYNDNWVEEFLDRIRAEGVPVCDNSAYLKEIYAEGILPFNQKYNAGHWNDRGAFYGMNNALSLLREQGANVHVNSEDEYEIVQNLNTTLPVSHFPIEEYEPIYKLKDASAIRNITDSLAGELHLAEGFTYFTDQVNATRLKEGSPRTLVFQGSYVNGMGYKFLRNALGEYIGVHDYQNVLDFSYYFNIFQPEAVIFEVAEYTLMDKYFSNAGIAEFTLNPLLSGFDGLPEKEGTISGGVSEGTALSVLTIKPDPDIMPENLLTKKGVYAYLLMGGDTFDMKKGSSGWTVTVKNAKVKDDRQVVIVDSEAGVKYVLSM